MIDPEGPLSYVIFVVLLLLSGFFSSTESALSYCNRHRIKVKADDGSKAAKLLVKVFDKFDEFIPPELLREAFARDRLRADEILERYI